MNLTKARPDKYTERLEMLASLLENLRFHRACGDIVKTTPPNSNSHKSVLPEKFNLTSWVGERDCGTSACAGGYASLFKPFRRLGLREDNGLPKFRKLYGEDALCVFFGLTSDESTYLFTPAAYSRRDRPSEVVRHIRTLIAGHKPKYTDVGL